MTKKLAALPLLLLLCATSAFAAPIVGGTTTIQFNATFLGLGLDAITPVAPAAFVSPFAQFPITGGDTTTQILHSGALILTEGTNNLAIGNFVIDVPTSTVSGNVFIAPPGVLFPPAVLFGVGPGNTLLLSNGAVGLLNDYFGLQLSGNPEIGVVFIEPILGGDVPEPATWALMGAGLAGILIARRRSA